MRERKGKKMKVEHRNVLWAMQRNDNRDGLSPTLNATYSSVALSAER